MAVIAVLLTDFGLADGYVGIMKGVMAQICPNLNIIDLSHQIPPQDLIAGRFCLLSAVDYFPKGTIFVAVVDPGVGSQRRGVGVAWQNHTLIAPDNGLLSGLLDSHPADFAVELTNRDYWRSSEASATFHGRDIFAPVAAHLARGLCLDNMGDRIALESLVRLSLPPLAMTQTGAIGSVQYIDHFGNIATNIPSHEVKGKLWRIQCNQVEISAGTTYSDKADGELVALIGSHGWVEIAVNGGSAAKRLGLSIGDRLELQWR